MPGRRECDWWRTFFLLCSRFLFLCVAFDSLLSVPLCVVSAFFCVLFVVTFLIVEGKCIKLRSEGQTLRVRLIVCFLFSFSFGWGEASEARQGTECLHFNLEDHHGLVLPTAAASVDGNFITRKRSCAVNNEA